MHEHLLFEDSFKLGTRRLCNCFLYGVPNEILDRLDRTTKKLRDKIGCKSRVFITDVTTFDYLPKSGLGSQLASFTGGFSQLAIFLASKRNNHLLRRRYETITNCNSGRHGLSFETGGVSRTQCRCAYFKGLNQKSLLSNCMVHVSPVELRCCNGSKQTNFNS